MDYYIGYVCLKTEGKTQKSVASLLRRRRYIYASKDMLHGLSLVRALNNFDIGSASTLEKVDKVELVTHEVELVALSPRK